MKKQLLEQCIESIRVIQSLKQDELDSSVAEELSETVDRLEFLLKMEADNVVIDQTTVKKVLTVIGRTAVALDWVREISQRFLE